MESVMALLQGRAKIRKGNCEKKETCGYAEPELQSVHTDQIAQDLAVFNRVDQGGVCNSSWPRRTKYLPQNIIEPKNRCSESSDQ